MAEDNVIYIKEGNKTLEPNTDTTLYFNKAKPSGDCHHEIKTKDNKIYVAILKWEKPINEEVVGKEVEDSLETNDSSDNDEAIEQPVIEVKDNTNTISYEDMTNDELKELLTSKGIEFNSKDNKTKLIKLLTEGE